MSRSTAGGGGGSRSSRLWDRGTEGILIETAITLLVRDADRITLIEVIALRRQPIVHSEELLKGGSVHLCHVGAVYVLGYKNPEVD